MIRRLAAGLALLLLLLHLVETRAGEIWLGWNPIEHPNYAAMRVCWGDTAAPPVDNDGCLEAPAPAVELVLPQMDDCNQYHFAAVAVGLDGQTSEAWSNVVFGMGRPEISVVAGTSIAGDNFDADVLVFFDPDLDADWSTWSPAPALRVACDLIELAEDLPAGVGIVVVVNVAEGRTFGVFGLPMPAATLFRLDGRD